jgi:Cu/Ag efflux pump CusA
MGDADSSFRSPMAVAVIGGLVTSTLLSLLVIPVAYSYLDDFNIWIKALWQRYPKAKISDI